MAAIAALPTATLRRNNNNKGVKSRRNERNILTFYEKIAVIRYYEETNISRNSLAKMFHCCATQIRRILDKKKDLLQQLASLSEADASIIIEEMTRKRRKFEMSAISFLLHEPSYRWLNRFRGKYKYEADELGYQGENPLNQDLPVEEIIVEFKHALPNFMQRELADPAEDASKGLLKPDFVNLSSENSLMSDHLEEDDEVEMVPESPDDDQMNAGTSTLLNGVFPHLAIIHQFALMNSDIQALELISQLGVHMQQQAVSGAYHSLSLATSGEVKRIRGQIPCPNCHRAASMRTSMTSS
ncbi:hypothetical protein M5D96_006566 [Drosophila gunungcola]|uniref:HTH psq-type domain-containing protein n=1 Tax=Drosophila gunungcola TaxID=103775 RepID=A0A9P9YP83_9MUSC|nr:hypothetical protein M5D96_006566 [Drosophila gunungcola]